MIILIGLISGWFVSGFLTGLIAVSSRNSFLGQPACKGDVGIIMACGILGPYIMIRCIGALIK